MPIFSRGEKIITLRKFIAARAEEKRLEELKLASNTSLTDQEKSAINLLTLGAAEIFVKLNVSGLTKVGQIASGYEYHSVTTTVEVGFGMAVSALGLDVDVELAASVAGTVAGSRLHIIQAQPMRFDVVWIDNAVYTGTVGSYQRYKYTSQRPYFLGYFTGLQWAVAVQARATAGFSIAGPAIAIGDTVNNVAARLGYDGDAIADEVSLSIDVEAEALAGYQGTYMRLVDNSPSFFLNLNDPDLLVALEANVGVGARNELMMGIAAWLKKTYAGQTQVITAANQIGSSFSAIFLNLSTAPAVVALQQAAAFEISKWHLAGSTYNTDNYNKIQHYRFLVGIVISQQFDDRAGRDAGTIFSKLQNMGFKNDTTGVNNAGTMFFQSRQRILVYCASMDQLPMGYAGDPAANTDLYILEFDQTRMYVYKASVSDVTDKIYLNSVRILPQPLFLAKPPKSYIENGKTAFLSYMGHNPSASASLKAEVFGMGPNAEVSAKAKFAKYRFQTFAPLTQSFFMTQDVAISYKQLGLTAAVLGRSLERAYNSLAYSAVICNWHATGNEVGWSSANAMYGSGVAFGVSISKKSLLKWSLMADTSPFKTKFATSLYVGVTDLNTFIAQLITKHTTAGTAGVNTIEFGTDEIIIEASFSANNISYWYNYISGSNSMYYQLDPDIRTKWINEFKSYPPGVLQQQQDVTPHTAAGFTGRFLRARVREEDAEEAENKKFTLGGQVGAFNVGLEIAEASKAGSEGVIDIFTYDLIYGCEYGTAPSVPYNPDTNTTAAIIAPVSLFFQ